MADEKNEGEILGTIDKIKATLAEMEDDVRRFRSGQKACATRIRKRLQLVKNLAHEARKEVSEVIQQRGGW